MAKKHKKKLKQFDQDAAYAAMAQFGGWPAGMAGAGQRKGLLNKLMRGRPSEQFLLGALLGAGAAWILADEELRGKVIKAGMKLYSGLAGGFEEMKEQMADIRAELEAGQHGEE